MALQHEVQRRKFLLPIGGSSNGVACGAAFDFFGFISIDMISYGCAELCAYGSAMVPIALRVGHDIEQYHNSVR